MTAFPARSGLSGGLWAALPIALGYFPISFSFGVAATRAGLTEIEAFSLSLLIYAGASQFLALALVTSGAPVLVSVFSLMAMNVRHVLYGPALLRQAGRDASTRHAWAWAFGLTDEVFGQALGSLARGQRFSEPFMLGIGFGAYASWLAGTLAGAMTGGDTFERFPAVSAAFDFLLPSLFLSLLLSLWQRRLVPVLAVAAMACIGVSLWIGPAAGIITGMIAGSVTGVLRR